MRSIFFEFDKRIRLTSCGLKGRAFRFDRKIVISIIALSSLILLPVLVPYALIDVFSPRTSENPTSSWFESWELMTWWDMQIESPTELEPTYRGLFETQASERSGVVEWKWNHGYNKLIISWGQTSLLIINSSEQFRDGWRQISQRRNVTDIAVIGNGELDIDARSWDFQEAIMKVNGIEVHAVIALAFYEERGMAYSITYFDTAPDVLERMVEWSSTFTTSPTPLSP